MPDVCCKCLEKTKRLFAFGDIVKCEVGTIVEFLQIQKCLFANFMSLRGKT